MRYFAIVKYDGSKFYGFQRQNDKRSVQNELEKSLSDIFGENILIKGAGRTDRGVHAKGQCFHFDTDTQISLYDIKKYINNKYSDLKIKSIKIVDDSIHSRFSVKSKYYSYKISFNKKDYDNGYVCFSKKLDIKKMKKASKLFLGVHNFQNFVSGTRDNYDCIIYKIKFHHFGNKLKIDFYGKSFYRYMVRNLVGALMDVGKGKANNSTIIRLLESEKTDKTLSTAPAKGLTLEKINY